MSRPADRDQALAPTPAPPRRDRREEAFALPLGERWATIPIRRRVLLGRAAVVAATVATGGTLACLRRPSPARMEEAGTRLDEAPWPTLAAAHDHLFPADGNGPSARDLHATAYLRALLDDPDFNPDDADFIRRGAGWLDELASKREGVPFATLAPAARERVVAEVAASHPGERWLSTLLLYLFEALLSDPIYGGNPDAIGWRWLDHQPGFPRPEPGQTYRALRQA